MSADDNDYSQTRLTKLMQCLDPAAQLKFSLGAIQPLARLGSVGYTFGWGTIQERRVTHFVLWDYIFTDFLEHAEHSLFMGLERHFECTSLDLFTVLGLTDRWQLYPGSHGRFSQVTHFAYEQEAREWVLEKLFPVLPDIMLSAQRLA